MRIGNNVIKLRNVKRSVHKLVLHVAKHGASRRSVGIVRKLLNETGLIKARWIMKLVFKVVVVGFDLVRPAQMSHFHTNDITYQ